MSPDVKLQILYTEDSEFMHEVVFNGLSVLLDANVTGCYENNQARHLIFEEGNRYDVYIFDDNTPETGGGYGTRLAVRTAELPAQECRSGIVITACSSNLAILGIKDDASWFSSTIEKPLTIEDLHQHDVEFWFKFTERFKMIAWIANCVKEGKVIPRSEWLESVGEDPRYETTGTGNDVESDIHYFVSTYLDESHIVAFLRLDFPAVFQQLREGKHLQDILQELGTEGKIKGERDH